MADLEQARARLARAQSVAVLTGAGISAESGIPTFRGAGGLWKTYRAQDLATPEAFARDPRLVWEWYDWRRGMIAQAAPNPAHHALVRLEAAKPRFTLITQNVDGLHERAGSSRVLKLHGDIWRMRCTVCGANWPDLRASLPKLPPHCACGGIARPGVVWFGEALPEGIMQEAEHAAESAEVFLVIGTSAVVYPAAGLVPHAKTNGAAVIEINLEATAFSARVDFSFQAPAGELLPKLV
ncbi:MAG TPA: NAD-dependent deacylase [Bryobacteraceae bacterium]|nr:NAD-dependent deacylase [Bryobacteraceae bacterium]